MRSWRSSEAGAAILFWMILFALAWSGCGITREVTLPNGYICYVDKLIWIAHPDVDGDNVGDVQELDVQGDLVFGLTSDAWNSEPDGYFIIDTGLRVTWRTHNPGVWRDQLAQLGVTELNLRWPGHGFNTSPARAWIPYTLIVFALLLAMLWRVRRLVRREQGLRRDLPERF